MTYPIKNNFMTTAKMLTVIHGEERTDFNQHSFRQIAHLVYKCQQCDCFHPHVTSIDEYEQHVLGLMTDDSKIHEMRHINEDDSER